MKKKCAVCNNLIDLTNEEVIARSIKYPNVNYCLCEECSEINVECSSNAPLIALDQVISESMQKDAEESIMNKILPSSSDLISLLSDMLSDKAESINKYIRDMKDTKESKEANKEANRETNRETNKVKIAKIKQSKEDKKNEQSKEVAYVAYSDKGIVEEFYEGTTLANAFNILVKKYGIDAVRTNKIKLFELNQIKPKIKETINYELDM